MAFDPRDEWFRRPDVWSGLVLGLWATTRSFGPSLMPRATRHQAMVSGASAATGFAVGNATYGVIGRRLPLERQPLAFGAALAAGLAARRALGAAPPEDLPLAAARATASGLAAGSAACGAVALVRTSERPARTAAVVGLAGAAAASVTMTRSLRDQLARRDEVDPPPPQPLPAVAQSATVAVGLAALVNGYRRSGRGMATLLRRRFGIGQDVAAVAGRVTATAAWTGVIYAFADTFVRGMALYDRVMDPGYDVPPASPTCSAGPGSALTFSRTGRQGRRFLLDRPSMADIADVMGEPAVAEPVRVFVGYDAARTPEDRVALALAELERTGAYDRRLLVVGSPAGTGYVDTVPFEAIDYLLRGDVASVAVQYERLPSLLCIHRVGVGGHHLRLLLAGIRDALVDRPADRRPEVVVFGESLGAWSGTNAFLHGGLEAMDAYGVSRALWVGVPYYSGWMREALEHGTVPDGTVVEVGSALPLRAMDATARDKLRVVMLNHGNDPVRKLCLDLLVAPPPWLGEVRPPGVPPRQRFVPGITGIQTIVDAANATNQIPGVFRATGHDYRLDLPAVVVEAYALPRPTAAQYERLLERLQADEAARAARFRSA